jgi:lysophospholipase L1-like esterase
LSVSSFFAEHSLAQGTYGVEPILRSKGPGGHISTPSVIDFATGQFSLNGTVYNFGYSANQVPVLNGSGFLLDSALNNVGTAGTYGDATHTLTLTTDAKGRLTVVTTNAITPGGIGAVSAVTVGNLTPLFTSNVSGTTTQAVTFSLSNAAGYSWFGNSGSGSGAPTFNTSVFPASLMPAFTGDANNTAGTLSLTVTKINGTTMSGLATGILKNTTGTGVPSIAVAVDFPTLNQNTTGSAAKLTTARNIGGFSFDGTADATLDAIDGISSNGFLARTATNARTIRQMAGTTNQITVTNANGVSGDPVFSIPSNAQLSIAKITNLTAGFVKSASDGTLSLDTNTYLTGSAITISTTSPLLGGGDLSTNRTFSLAGLSGLGTANQVLGMNNGATAYEYKTISVGTSGSDFGVVLSGANAITFNLPTASSSNRGALSTADWTTFNNKQAALGFTPYNATNPSAYISGITSGMVTTALGFTPYNATNPSGYITSAGNAATATALATGRTLSITGDLTWTSPSFDGSGNVTNAGTLATVNGNVGSFGDSSHVATFTTNGKGLLTAAGSAAITPAAIGAEPAITVGAAAAYLNGIKGYSTFNSADGLYVNTASSVTTYGINNAGIANAKLANSTVSIAGTSIALGGSITLDTIDNGLAVNGLIVRTAANTRSARTLIGTTNQVSVSNGDGVSGNPTISVPSNAQLSIAKITNQTSNGFLKTGSSDGTLSIDTTSYQAALGYTAANDSAVVHLAGSETIGGSKIFSNPIGIGTTPIASMPIFAHAATDENFGVRGHADYTSGIQLDAWNDATSGYVPMAFRSTYFGFYGGAISAGTWNASPISDTYIASASTWNAKENALTFINGITRSTNTIGLGAITPSSVTASGPVNAADHTIGITGSYSANVVFEGDSITQQVSDVSGAPNGYNNYMGAAGADGVSAVPAIGTYNGIAVSPSVGQNVAVAGKTIQDLYETAARVNALYRQEAGMNVVVYDAGTNNLGLSPYLSAEQTYSLIEAICKHHRQNGWRVIVVGLTSRGGTQSGTGIAYDTLVGTVNALIRQNWAQFADHFVDWGVINGGSNEFNTGGYSNTTWYQGDQLHHTFAGGRKFASYIQPVINDLLTYYFQPQSNPLFVRANKTTHNANFPEGMLTLSNENPTGGLSEINFAFNKVVKGSVWMEADGASAKFDQPIQALSSTKVPTTGKGAVMYYDATYNYSHLQSYKWDATQAWEPWIIEGSSIKFATNGTDRMLLQNGLNLGNYGGSWADPGSGNFYMSGSLIATNLTGTLQTAAQPNVTSLGTLTSLTTSGNVTLPSTAVLTAGNTSLSYSGGYTTFSQASGNLIIGNYNTGVMYLDANVIHFRSGATNTTADGSGNWSFNGNVSANIFSGGSTTNPSSSTAGDVALQTQNAKGGVLWFGNDSTRYLQWSSGVSAYVFGNASIYVNGTLYTSSAAVKQNIKDYQPSKTSTATNAVLNLKPRTYQYKSLPNQNRVGFVAEEVQKILPEAVMPAPDDPAAPGEKRLGIDPMVLIASLTQEVQQQRKEIDELKAAQSKTISSPSPTPANSF